MKFAAFTIITDPEHRQDPWREWIAQALLCFETIVIVYGRQADGPMIEKWFSHEYYTGRILIQYMHWPQPAWSFDELPKHLNVALDILRKNDFDWAVRLDCDTTIHEKDIGQLGSAIRRMDTAGIWIGGMAKLQFFMPTLCFHKGRIQNVINLRKPIAYGFNSAKYTDLCQPVRWDGSSKANILIDGKVRHVDIPAGRAVNDSSIADVPGMEVWNYDYTFKTADRARELLYEFDRAHERFWNHGYSGKQGEEITHESAMQDFINLASGRFSRMRREMEIDKHPRHFQESLRSLTSPQFGHSLWGKIVG